MSVVLGPKSQAETTWFPIWWCCKLMGIFTSRISRLEMMNVPKPRLILGPIEKSSATMDHGILDRLSRTFRALNGLPHAKKHDVWSKKVLTTWSAWGETRMVILTKHMKHHACQFYHLFSRRLSLRQLTGTVLKPPLWKQWEGQLHCILWHLTTTDKTQIKGGDCSASPICPIQYTWEVVDSLTCHKPCIPLRNPRSSDLLHHE